MTDSVASARTARPPRRRARVMIGFSVATALAAFTFWVHLYQFGAGLQWDAHVFLLVGKWLREGLVPYRDAWEIKPPGIFFYVAAVFGVLPAAMWSLRVADFVVYLAAAVAFYRVCRLEVNPLLALIGACAWIFVSHHDFFNLGGLYTEEYAAAFGLMSLAAGVACARDPRWHQVFLCGLAASISTLFKHPGAAVLIPVAFLLTSHPGWWRLLLCPLVLAMGFSIPVAAVAAFFLRHDALQPLIDCNVWDLVNYPRLNVSVDAWETRCGSECRAYVLRILEQVPILTTLVVVGTLPLIAEPSRLRLGALSWLAVSLLGVTLQGRFYPHHFILLFPPACLVATLAAGWFVARRTLQRWWHGIPRLVVAFAALTGVAREAWHVHNARRPELIRQWNALLAGPARWRVSPAGSFEDEIGRYVRDRSVVDETLHVHGWNGSALGIYWAADRRPASRYFYGVPYPIPYQVQLHDLAANRPAYVVMVDQGPGSILAAWLNRNYSLETTKVGNFRAEIFVRHRPRDFTSGTIENLAPLINRSGLAIAPRSRPGGGFWAQGVWTSPPVASRSDDGKALVDWSPFSDVARNRLGFGPPTAEAGVHFADNDVRLVFDLMGRTDRWLTPPGVNQSITLRLGAPAMVDRIEIEFPTAEDAADGQITLAAARVATDAAGDAPPVPIAAQWRLTAPDRGELRFARRRADALRLDVRTRNAARPLAIRRVRVPAAGMGVRVRYRTGPTTELTAAPWNDVPEGDAPAYVPADRYVQVQCELWTEHADVSPVLRWVQLGAEHYALLE